MIRVRLPVLSPFVGVIPVKSATALDRNHGEHLHDNVVDVRLALRYNDAT